MHKVKSFFSGIFGFILILVLIILGIGITINFTVLNSNFIISELDKLDAYSLAIDEIGEQLKSQMPEDQPLMTEVVEKTLTDLEPWLKEQLPIVIQGGYAYLKGGEELNIIIPLGQVKDTLKENLAQAIRESPPPELEGASSSEIEDFASQAWIEMNKQMQIPEQFEINESLLEPEMLVQIQQVKEIIGYVQLSYKALIGLVILLILIIALIQWWQAKAITRCAGISFAIAGVISLVGAIVSKNFILQSLQLDIPPEIGAKLPQLISDFLSPLQIYSIGILIAGILLIVLSIKLKYPSPKTE